MSKSIVISLVSSLIIIACSGAPNYDSSSLAPSHALFDELLKKYVDKKGMVDYKGFISEKAKLNKYLQILSNNPPDKDSWSEEEQLAYWINAYNSFTIELIIDNYPVESITDLHPTIHIPLVSTVWHKKFFKIGGKESSLDEIEHDILRKEFEEPRIHFAINCASFSCPPLRAEAYTADKLDRQLEEQAMQFINDPLRNKLSADNPEISKIFKWFSGDFKTKGSLIEYLNKYSEVKIDENADIDYMEYDWTLNDLN